jgi:hypothetical protein
MPAPLTLSDWLSLRPPLGIPRDLAAWRVLGRRLPRRPEGSKWEGQVSWTRWWRKRQAAAHRWLAEPPGPPRDVPPTTAAERWLTGRRGLLTTFGGVVALVLVGSLVVGSLVAVIPARS